MEYMFKFANSTYLNRAYCIIRNYNPSKSTCMFVFFSYFVLRYLTHVS